MKKLLAKTWIVTAISIVVVIFVTAMIRDFGLTATLRALGEFGVLMLFMGLTVLAIHVLVNEH